MLLSTLIKVVAPTAVFGKTDAEVTHVSHDSRDVRHDGIFVAIIGSAMDGRRFAKNLNCQAVISETNLPVKEGVTVLVVNDARQALADISAALAGYPCRDMTLIGLTGTNGKTTTAWLLEHIGTSLGLSIGVLGTLGHRLNGEASGRQDGRTTPEASMLQPLLKEWRNKGCQWVIMEVSSIGLSLKRVAGIEFDIAAWTNFSQDHLDFHEDMDDYFKAKASLFRERLNTNAVSILNHEDPNISKIQPAKGTRLFFGQTPSADIHASDISMSPHGIKCQITAKGETKELHLPLIGRYNLDNAMTAIGCALSAGADFHDIIQALTSLPQAPGRMERIENNVERAIFVDYAHTPDALQRALEALRPICKGNLMVVIGCGGDRDPSKRPEMGRIAKEYSDRCYITSDNPRTENPNDIIRDILSDITTVHFSHHDRQKTIHHAIAEMGVEDVLLIAGKGHEEYQEIGAVKIAFSDKRVALSALGAHR